MPHTSERSKKETQFSPSGSLRTNLKSDNNALLLSNTSR